MYLFDADLLPNDLVDLNREVQTKKNKFNLNFEINTSGVLLELFELFDSDLLIILLNADTAFRILNLEFGFSISSSPSSSSFSSTTA